MHSSGKRWGATAVAAVSAIVVAGCGHSSSPTSSPTASNAPLATSAASTGGVDFGTAKDVCGPGKPQPSAARGVTASTIKIGVLNDATSTIDPGLGAIYLNVAKAFSDWCNAAGGINGRKIVIVNHDAQITEAAARIQDACVSDFMLVGGATPFDVTTVQPRISCGLGSIPAYAASPQANHSQLQALVAPISSTQGNVGIFKTLDSQYHDAFHKMGLMAIDTPSLLLPAQTAEKGLKAYGLPLVSFQKIPVGVANWRTYVQPLVGKVQALLPPPGDDTQLYQAMKDVGYTPKVMLGGGYLYNKPTIDGLKAAGITTPFYVGIGGFPLELASQNPTLQKAIDLTKATHPSQPVDGGIITSWAAWLLFAQSAMQCSDLTVDCVIQHAKAQTAYTAGDLLAPVDISNPDHAGACFAILRGSASGFTYDRADTKPTQGIYNCDPANIVKIS